MPEGEWEELRAESVGGRAMERVQSCGCGRGGARATGVPNAIAQLAIPPFGLVQNRGYSKFRD
jgi:hypothetical protein